jgi:flagellin-specific chaperone FliS
VRHKIYTNKYTSGSLEALNRAALSTLLCEKIIALISSAKVSLEKGDKAAWDRELAKVPEEIRELISAIDVEGFGQAGDEMRQFYLQISFRVFGLVSRELDPSVADELLEQMFAVRNIWKELDARYVAELQNSHPESGGLI